MSRENVELIERMMQRAQFEPEALREILSDSVEWEAPFFPDAGMLRGPDSVMDFFRRLVGTFDDWGYEVGEVINAGECVLTHVHQWGRGKGSGATVDQHFWQIWTIRNGKVIKVTHRLDRTEALEAVGLRE
jgi:ketosteroid isomerase-like protein